MVLAASSNSSQHSYDSKHNIVNYEFAVKYYLDLTKAEKQIITKLCVTSFKNILNYDATSKDFEDTLFGTLSVILYFKGKIIGYCSLCPYVEKQFSIIEGQKYTTFGVHWLCVDKQFRGNYLGTEILAKAFNIVQQIATRKPHPVILFGEFTPHSHYLAKKLFQNDSSLVLGFGLKTKIGSLIAHNYAQYWSEYVELDCTSDDYGLLTNGRRVIVLHFN